jgi:hypothetical protein
MMDEQVQLAQQTLGDLNAAFIAGNIRQRGFVRQAALPSRTTRMSERPRRRLSCRQSQTFDNHGGQSRKRRSGRKIRTPL